jgi:IS4 transposase
VLAFRLKNSGAVITRALGAVLSILYVQFSLQVNNIWASSVLTLAVFQGEPTKAGTVVSFVIVKVVEPTSLEEFFTQAKTLLAQSAKSLAFIV